MLRLGAPMIFFNILFFLTINFPDLKEDLDCVEYYAGEGVICDAFRYFGKAAEKWDIRYDEVNQNALLAEGFLHQVALGKRLKRRKGLGTWGTVCSSWAFMSRSGTGRSGMRPLGFEDRQPVMAGNMMVCRMCLILLFFYATARHWLLEQPGTSIMKRAPWPRFLWSRLPVWLTHTWMCMFGGETMKSIELASGSKWTLALHRTRDTEKDHQWQAISSVRHEAPNADGRIRVSGHSGLKGSQEYPPRFGFAIAKEFLINGGLDEDIDIWMDEATEIDWATWQRANSEVDWSYANLGDVAEFLEIPADQPMRQF